MSATLEVISNGLEQLLNKLSQEATKEMLLNEIGIGSVAKTKKKIQNNEALPPPGKKGKKEGIIMVDSGRGLRSITWRVDPKSEEVAIGTNVEYMAINRDGLPEKNYKGRGYEFLFMLDQDEIQKVFEKWFMELIR